MNQEKVSKIISFQRFSKWLSKTLKVTKPAKEIKSLFWHYFKIWLLTLGGINLFMVFFYNYKYGSAAAKNIQDEIKKNKKTRNFNSLSYFRSLQTYWGRLYPKYQKVNLDDLKQNKKVTFIAGDEKKLSGLVYKNDLNHKWVVVLHGWTQNKYAVMHIVNMYLNMKYNVLVYDSRGHGESEPTACTLGFYEKNDLDSACEYLIKNYQVEEISFHGQSMGAITILLYLNVLQVKSHNQLFKRAVLDCPASHMPRQMNNYYSKYFALPRFFFMFGMTYFLKKLNHYSGRNIIPIRRIYKSWRWPYFFIHGTGDTIIDCNMSVDLYNQKQDKRSEIWLVDKAEHVSCFQTDPVKYQDKVKAFFVKTS